MSAATRTWGNGRVVNVDKERERHRRYYLRRIALKGSCSSCGGPCTKTAERCLTCQNPINARAANAANWERMNGEVA